MNIKKALCRIGIMLSVTAAIATSQTTSQESVKIGNLTWTKQNINIEMWNNQYEGCWCYDDDKSNCAKYGRLYSWKAAKMACRSMGDGWRLPTREDWNNLVDYAGGSSVAGKKLKSKSGWNRCDSDGKDCVKDGNGTDDYGFTSLPGGFRYSHSGNFESVGGAASWWSATEADSSGVGAYYWVIYNSSDRVSEGPAVSWNGFSVRCVQGKN